MNEVERPSQRCENISVASGVVKYRYSFVSIFFFKIQNVIHFSSILWFWPCFADRIKSWWAFSFYFYFFFVFILTSQNEQILNFSTFSGTFLRRCRRFYLFLWFLSVSINLTTLAASGISKLTLQRNKLKNCLLATCYI